MHGLRVQESLPSGCRFRNAGWGAESAESRSTHVETGSLSVAILIGRDFEPSGENSAVFRPCLSSFPLRSWSRVTLAPSDARRNAPRSLLEERPQVAVPTHTEPTVFQGALGPTRLTGPNEVGRCWTDTTRPAYRCRAIWPLANPHSSLRPMSLYVRFCTRHSIVSMRK